MNLVKGVAALVAAVVAAATFASVEAPKDSVCGAAPNRPPVQLGVETAQSVGEFFYRLQRPVPESDVERLVHGTTTVLGLWWTAGLAALRSEPVPQPAADLESAQLALQQQHDQDCAPRLTGLVAGGLRIGTWNVLLSNRGVVAGVMGMTASADVIGFQELRGWMRPKLRAALRAKGWQLTTDGNAVSIAFNATKFELVQDDGSGDGSIGYEKRILTGGRVEGGTIPSKTIVWVILRDRETGAEFAVANTHFLWEVDKRGHPDPNRPRRVAKFRLQLQRSASLLRTLTRGGTRAVFMTCDCNVDVGADQNVGNEGNPVAVMKGSGFRTSWQLLGEKPTHGKRTIDSVWYSAGLFPVAQAAGCTCGSDHRQVVITFGTPDGKSTEVQAA